MLRFPGGIAALLPHQKGIMIIQWQRLHHESLLGLQVCAPVYIADP